MSFIKQYHGKLLPVVAPLLSLQQVRRYGMVTQRTIFTGRPLLSCTSHHTLNNVVRNESYRWMMAQRLKSSLMYSQATSNHSALASTRCLRQYSTDITVDVNTSATLSRVDASTLTLDWQHGPSNTFLHFWLRDHCPCSQCQHSDTKQRSVDTFMIPMDIQPDHIAIEQDNLKLTWPDGHKTNYPLSWLYQQLPNNQSTRMKESIAAATTTLWDAGILDTLPAVSYKEVMNTEQGVHQWLQLIKQYGIGFVKDVPPNAFDTEKLALRISHIRHTHYGGFWEFTADMAHNDTAYTTLSLQLHTDNTYFTDPAGLQMFHILRPADKGGESLFLDGFNAARILYEKDPHAYRVLSTTRTNAMACGDNRFNIQPAHAYPLLNHLPTTINGVIESVADTSQSSIDRLFQVRYNNDDRAPLCLDVHETREYYQTLRVWQSIVRDPANILEIALPPGLVVCFDNWRVLHGRNAFVGRRQVCGCYHGADDWHSRLRALSERNNSIDNNIH